MSLTGRFGLHFLDEKEEDTVYSEVKVRSKTTEPNGDTYGKL